MTSERKIKANRANSRASSGPKTSLGRVRAAQNALRHGLSLSIHSDRALSKEVEALAREIAGTDVDAERKEFARRIAEAQIDLRRIRHARHQLLSETQMQDDVMKVLNSKTEGPHKFATTLSDKALQLLVLDRYERRARSQRKFAIRAFDTVRVAAN